MSYQKADQSEPGPDVLKRYRLAMEERKRTGAAVIEVRTLSGGKLQARAITGGLLKARPMMDERTRRQIARVDQLVFELGKERGK